MSTSGPSSSGSELTVIAVNIRRIQPDHARLGTGASSPTGAARRQPDRRQPRRCGQGRQDNCADPADDEPAAAGVVRSGDVTGSCSRAHQPGRCSSTTRGRRIPGGASGGGGSSGGGSAGAAPVSSAPSGGGAPAPPMPLGPPTTPAPPGPPAPGSPGCRAGGSQRTRRLTHVDRQHLGRSGPAPVPVSTARAERDAIAVRVDRRRAAPQDQRQRPPAARTPHRRRPQRRRYGLRLLLGHRCHDGRHHRGRQQLRPGLHPRRGQPARAGPDGHRRRIRPARRTRQVGDLPDPRGAGLGPAPRHEAARRRRHRGAVRQLRPRCRQDHPHPGRHPRRRKDAGPQPFRGDCTRARRNAWPPSATSGSTSYCHPRPPTSTRRPTRPRCCGSTSPSR